MQFTTLDELCERIYEAGKATEEDVKSYLQVLKHDTNDVVRQKIKEFIVRIPNFAVNIKRHNMSFQDWILENWEKWLEEVREDA